MLDGIINKAKSFLVWSQKYTHTDMLYLAKGGFWLTLGQGVASLSALALTIVFTRIVSKDVYGTYKYILSIAGILSALTLSGMNTAVTRAVAQGFEGALIKSFWIQLKWGLILFGAALIGSIYYWMNGNNVLALSLLIIGIFLPISTSANTYTAFLNGKKEFSALSRFGIFSSIIPSCVTMFAILLTHKVVYLVLTYFIIYTGTNLFFYFKTLRTYRPNKLQDTDTINYGKHLSLINILSIVAMYFDKLVVFHYLGAAEVAIYSIAIAPPEQIKAFLKNISNLSLPKFSDVDYRLIKRNIIKKTLQFTVVISLIAAIYVMAAPFLYKIVFPKYPESISYSQIFVLSLMTVALFVPLSSLQARQQTKKLYIFNAVTSLLQILLLIPLTRYYGLMGTVVARVITRYINLALSLVLV